MNWWALGSLFAFSMVKFMFTPFSGPVLGLNFIEVYVSCVAGAIFSATIFFFLSSFFMNRAQEKKMMKELDRQAKGLAVKKRKIFTRTNKFVVKIKRSIGIIGVSFWAPFFLSIPLGTIIAAKFYGKQRKTFPLIVLGILLNGIITTGSAYLLYG